LAESIKKSGGARRAIVSNLTIWDTYGKLVGLNRTPPEIKKTLNAAQGSGAFVVYTTIEEAAVARLPGERLLVVSPPADEEEFSEFTFAIHGHTATLKSATDVREWFTYHASEEDFEESDQAALERFWTKLHAALPELGGDIEVIESANPRTYYDQTRRKLGMVMGASSGFRFPSPGTFLPNVFVVSDTVTQSPNLASLTEAAVSLARHINNL
jgi:phytoene dehydrogenase-like protein